MFCWKCGSQNDDNAYRCVQCNEVIQKDAAGGSTGQNFQASPAYGGGHSHYSTEHVPSYLAQAILVTLFCCLPFGIVSIVYAASVNSKVRMGDVYGARMASDKARSWAWASFGCGLVATILWFLLIVVAGGY